MEASAVGVPVRKDDLILVPKESRSFGRYHLYCRLAKGGMANLYLAQYAGPDGFEKLVAIKRIHEHLSEDADFVTMFSDEARLAARSLTPTWSRCWSWAPWGRRASSPWSTWMARAWGR